MRKIINFIKEVPFWKLYLSDFFIWAAIKLDADNQCELNRAKATYSVCEDIARGKLKAPKETRSAAYAAAY